ncbi:MAG TPA: hypothetical protein VGI81_01755 [Tepidisphaeraceae bacterium]
MDEKLEQIRQLLRRKPFRPFRVLMRSGARHEIIDPNKVAVAATRAVAFLPRMTDMPEDEIELVYEPRQARR